MIKLLKGDCLEQMKTLADNSVDSIVCDPPYGISFMGKKWDYDVPSAEVWAEAIRVLKHGGHALIACGTRTQHRMVVNIEDAGFEIRDVVSWVYGSGFPKSLDVSKEIDKRDAAEAQIARKLKFTQWVRSQGVRGQQIDAATKTQMGGHYTTSASQPAIMTREHLEACRHLFSDVPKWVEDECDKRSVESENLKRREVIGQKTGIDMKLANAASPISAQGIGKCISKQIDITAPATEAAKKWDGWGTAIKPACEFFTLARKPLAERTVAANVLKWGTGAINIDGCRTADAGRFPTNLIHDGSQEVMELFPRAGKASAARFFYCPKTSRADREEGNNHPTVKPTSLMSYLCRLITPKGGTVLDPYMGSGSTGKAAVREGFSFVGCELDSDYYEIAKSRVEGL